MNQEQKDLKEALERAEKNYNQANERFQEMQRARAETRTRLNEHYKELMNLDLSKVHAWVSVKSQLTGVIDALDVLYPTLAERRERTQKALNQAKVKAIREGVS